MSRYAPGPAGAEALALHAELAARETAEAKKLIELAAKLSTGAKEREARVLLAAWRELFPEKPAPRLKLEGGHLVVVGPPPLSDDGK